MTLNQLNELNEKIYQKSSVSKLENIQDYDFIISKTQMSISENDFLKKYLIDECQIKIAIKNTDKLFILRTVFMNQWPISTTKDYLSEFINFLLSRT